MNICGFFGGLLVRNNLNSILMVCLDKKKKHVQPQSFEKSINTVECGDMNPVFHAVMAADGGDVC